MKWILKILVGLAGTGLLALLFLVIATLAVKDKTLVQSCQPKELNYQSFDPYCLQIVQLAFSNKREIRVLKEAELKSGGNYGFHEDFAMGGKEGISLEHLKQTKIDWKADGIHIDIVWIESEGKFPIKSRYLFIAKEKFIGGR